MRDCSTNRAGFDRVLMAVAATFLTVSATSALAAQVDNAARQRRRARDRRSSPRPEPANVPPPTVGDFKMDTTATVPDATKAIDKPAGAKPAETVTAPAANDAATAAHSGGDRHGAPPNPARSR